jgi:hypothetical protein
MAEIVVGPLRLTDPAVGVHRLFEKSLLRSVQLLFL